MRLEIRVRVFDVPHDLPHHRWHVQLDDSVQVGHLVGRAHNRAMFLVILGLDGEHHTERIELIEEGGVLLGDDFPSLRLQFRPHNRHKVSRVQRVRHVLLQRLGRRRHLDALLEDGNVPLEILNLLHHAGLLLLAYAGHMIVVPLLPPVEVLVLGERLGLGDFVVQLLVERFRLRQTTFEHFQRLLVEPAAFVAQVLLLIVNVHQVVLHLASARRPAAASGPAARARPLPRRPPPQRVDHVVRRVLVDVLDPVGRADGGVLERCERPGRRRGGA